jgi:hypothetical protein
LANLFLRRLDLTVASRVYLMEPGWNPMLERQALDRIHRLGQTKDVVSRCYVVGGIDSIEEVSENKCAIVPKHD